MSEHTPKTPVVDELVRELRVPFAAPLTAEAQSRLGDLIEQFAAERDRLREELAEAGSDVAGLVTERESLLRSIDRLRALNGELVKALEGARDYFEPLADGEYYTESPGAIANEEMKQLVDIETALAKAREAQP